MIKANIPLYYIITVLTITVSCSSNKKISAPSSLYKSEKGKAIAYESYNKTMELWDVEYKEEFVETDYGKSHVIVSGEENELPLFLLPGLFADATMWYPNVKELSRHFKVYTLDMPNYGGKSKPSGKAVVSMEDYRTWFTRILKHYQIEKASVAGLSYSSWLALALAREMPDTIASITLLDPSETFMPMNSSMAWKGFRYFMFFPNRKKYEKFFDWMGGGYTDPQMEVWFEHMLDVIEYGSVGMFDVPQHKIYQPEELEMIKMPVLVMAGGKPIIYNSPEKFKENALKAIPHANVIIVPDAGHGLNMEKPEIVNKKMIEFLNNNNKINRNECY
jgi:pimeloyl-ACP methyl ester carboxylesterase